MNKYHFIGVILCILFFTLFFYYFLNYQNEIIGYQVILNNEDKDYNLNPLENKLKRKKCSQFCNKPLCNQYNNKLENYKKCLNCARHFKCYDIINDTCSSCFSMGIDQCKLPIDPKNEFCK